MSIFDLPSLGRDGLILAHAGGERFSHEDGWFIAPPIFSFSSRRKRENGPCTVQKRKRSIWILRWTKDAQGVLPVSRMSSARGVVLAGVWCPSNGPAPLSAAATLAASEALPPVRIKREGGRCSSDGSAGLAAARRGGQSFLQLPKPPLALRRGQGLAYQEVRTMPRPRNATPSFSLFHRARRILSFSPVRKRENGGCIAPAIAGHPSSPPEGRVQAPLSE